MLPVATRLPSSSTLVFSVTDADDGLPIEAASLAPLIVSVTVWVSDSGDVLLSVLCTV